MSFSGVLRKTEVFIASNDRAAKSTNSRRLLQNVAKTCSRSGVPFSCWYNCGPALGSWIPLLYRHYTSLSRHHGVWMCECAHVSGVSAYACMTAFLGLFWSRAASINKYVTWPRPTNRAQTRKMVAMAKETALVCCFIFGPLSVTSATFVQNLISDIDPCEDVCQKTYPLHTYEKVRTRLAW